MTNLFPTQKSLLYYYFLKKSTFVETECFSTTLGVGGGRGVMVADKRVIKNAASYMNILELGNFLFKNDG